MQPCGSVTDFSHRLTTVPASIPRTTRENMAEGAKFELADALSEYGSELLTLERRVYGTTYSMATSRAHNVVHRSGIRC